MRDHLNDLNRHRNMYETKDQSYMNISSSSKVLSTISTRKLNHVWYGG